MPTIRVSDINAQILLSPGIYLRTVEQELSLEQETFRRTIRVESLACQLLVEFVEPPPPGGEQVDDFLTLTQTIVDFLEISARQVVSDTLDFEESFEAFGLDTLNDGLLLEQLIEFIGPRYETVEQSLNLQEGVAGFIGVPWAPIVVEQTILFNQFASALAPLHIQQTLQLVDSAVRRTIAEDFLLFVQTIKAGKGKTVSQTLGVSDSFESSDNYLRSVDQDLGIQQSVAYFIESRCGRKTNNRFDGEGAELPEPKRIKYHSQMILSYGSQSVSLRNPENDDRARFAFQRINRETLGGVLDIYADPDWDQSTTLLFTVVAMKANMLEALQAFMEATVGEEITLHDWEGVNWKGVVTTPNESAVEDGEGYWTLAFEFVGVREPGEVPLNILELSQVVGKQVDYTRTVEQSIGFIENPHVAGPINVTVSQVIPFQSGA